MHPSGNSGGYFSCKPPSLVAFEVLLVYICVHLCVCGRVIMREQLYFSFFIPPHRHLALIKEKSRWSGLWPPAVVPLQKQWLYSAHGVLLGQTQKHTALTH